MPEKNKLKTILRKNIPQNISRRGKIKKENDNPVVFVILVIVLIAVIFGAYKFFARPQIQEMNQNNNIVKNIDPIQSGVDDLNTGKIDEAGEKFAEILQKDSGNTQAIYNLAIVKYNKGQYDEAITDLQGLVQNDSKNAEAYNILGNINRDLKKFDEAEKNYRQALEANPNFLPAYSNLVIMFADNGKRVEAKKVIAEGLKNNPDSEDLKNMHDTFFGSSK